MNFRETARRMISDWYKNKKRAGSDSPKNVVQENSQVMEACDRVMGYNTKPPKNDAEKRGYTFGFTGWKTGPEESLKPDSGKRMEAVIKSIVTNPSMGDHFAYFNATPLCGWCGMEMFQDATHYELGSSAKLRIRCLNWACSHNGILYEVVPEKSAVIVMRRVDEKKTE